MIIAIHNLDTVVQRLSDLKVAGAIIEYRATLKLNLDVFAVVFVEETGKIDWDREFGNNHVYVQEVSLSEAQHDSFYSDILSQLQHSSPQNGAHTDMSLRRRLTNLLDHDRPTAPQIPKGVSIITFYSYKGGMGRSTALATYAAHYAYHHKAKVVVMDCDFEAPGFTNFFDLDEDILSQKNGVVEYLINRQYTGESLDLQGYAFEISKDYTGEGSVRVIPAGNLSNLPAVHRDVEEVNLATKSHREHYLEALARLDIAGGDYIIDLFGKLIQDVATQIKPDLILIDSRTGFNDVFGLTAFHFSNLIIGFFGNNKQTKPGLEFFLDFSTTSRKGVNVLLVNSIISSLRVFEKFQSDVNSFFESHLENMESGLPSVQVFPVLRDTRLELLGTSEESRKDYMSIIQDATNADYRRLFQAIDELLFDFRSESLTTLEPLTLDEDDAGVETGDNTPLESRETGSADAARPKQHPPASMGLKKRIIESLLVDYPEPYAESIQDTEFVEEVLNRKFYFRRSMEDVFNPDKYLLIGGKGTGKTYFYRALQNPHFLAKLKKRAGKTEQAYASVGVVSRPRDGLFFDTGAHIHLANISQSDLYFRRFWTVYTWNAIAFRQAELGVTYPSGFGGHPLKSEMASKEWLESYIYDDKHFYSVERDLEALDAQLDQQDLDLLVLYDLLDMVIRPIDWGMGVSPLIGWWRNRPYKRLQPKLFLRTDLVSRIEGTNIQNLRSQIISLEWSKEEIFAFFFKAVFATVKTEFFNAMYRYGDIPRNSIQEMKGAAGIDNQIPLDKKYLEPLVETFFGKYADARNPLRSNAYGLSYDWFFNNLKNADDTISLRPFLDLIRESLGYYAREKMVTDHHVKPILPATYYAHPANRKNSVERHFEDLAQEPGNTSLKGVFNYISKKAPDRLRKTHYTKREFEELLQNAIQDQKTEINDVDKLKELMIRAGIVAEVPISGGHLTYRFAFLYKYYLGLKSPRAN